VTVPRIASIVAVLGALAISTAGAQSRKLTDEKLRVQLDSATYPLDIQRAPIESRLPGRYIVLFREGLGDSHAAAKAMVEGRGGTVHYTYADAVNGFAATLDADSAESLRFDPRVALIEEDRVVHTTALPMPISPESPAHSWAMDRIDQRLLPLDNSFSFPANGGAGVHIYMIDSGILGGFFGLQGAHVDLEGRIGSGADFIDPPTDGNDCLFHGTFDASLAAGTTMGIAKLATVHPVRVIDCGDGGSASGVIAGVNWVTQDHRAHPGQKSVANMSLTVGGIDTAVDAAVNASIGAGIVYTFASGNNGPFRFDTRTELDLADACNLSPQRVAAGLTVGAMGSVGPLGDQVASFSDVGLCVDLYAPGVQMTGAWFGNRTAFSGPGFDGVNHFGTSWSAPLVAGTAALFLNAHPNASAGATTSAILLNATSGVLSPSAATDVAIPNKLLYIDFQTDLVASVTSSKGAPNAGTSFTYTYTVKNNGPYNSMDPVLFLATLPAAVTVTSVVPSRGTCGGTSQIGCNAGRLAVGEQATFAVTVTAPPAVQSFTATGTAILQSGQTDGVPANNTASLTLTTRQGDDAP
jgi:uncharacterized repeat protein (TIGR01451 family)